MDWQLWIVGVLVAAAVLYLGRQTYRTWAGRKAGCGTCKCGPAKDPAAPLIPVEQLELRRR
jgi:hypothetical protein